MRAEKAKIIAAELLGIGKNKVWLNPEETESIKEAITKDDVRELISNGTIKKTKSNAQSRGRARVLKEKKSRGRRKNRGSRKGTKGARSKRKDKWIGSVRAQRALLKELKEKEPEKTEKIGYQKVYRMVKGGYFKSKAHLKKFITGVK